MNKTDPSTLEEISNEVIWNNKYICIEVQYISRAAFAFKNLASRGLSCFYRVKSTFLTRLFKNLGDDFHLFDQSANRNISGQPIIQLMTSPVTNKKATCQLYFKTFFLIARAHCQKSTLNLGNQRRRLEN
ncbi:hypothetical protein ACROYT_G022547 [Oculina patagonica]